MSKKTEENSDDKGLCGIIMPIGSTEQCTEAHWAEVLDIIKASADDTGYKSDLVSNSDEVTVIQKTIVQNVYEREIVVCDVSERNPNVMFELGLRLAFDKPTIVVKDDQTPFSFDTSPIEHLEYRRDLRFSSIVSFKNRLTAKIRATAEKSRTDPTYSTFLSHFGSFKVAKLNETEVPGQEYIISQLEKLNQRISIFAVRDRMQSRNSMRRPVDVSVCCLGIDETGVKEIFNFGDHAPGAVEAKIVPFEGHTHVEVTLDSDTRKESDYVRRKLQAEAERLRHQSRNALDGLNST